VVNIENKFIRAPYKDENKPVKDIFCIFEAVSKFIQYEKDYL
jgi:hypothetical protein